jgi:hypothetical protein
MSNLTEDVKERRYNKIEYALEDGSGGMALELIPASSPTATERTKVVVLDDLKVPQAHSKTNEIVEEESA